MKFMTFNELEGFFHENCLYCIRISDQWISDLVIMEVDKEITTPILLVLPQLFVQ